MAANSAAQGSGGEEDAADGSLSGSSSAGDGYFGTSGSEETGISSTVGVLSGLALLVMLGMALYGLLRQGQSRGSGDDQKEQIRARFAARLGSTEAK